MKIYDAENQILGRIASVISKQLLDGETVFVVNAEKAVISGSPKSKQEFYAKRVKRGDIYKGPFFPRQPDAIFRRTVRGMIPFDRDKGRKAYRRLKVFTGVPEELKNKSVEKTEADASKLTTKYISLSKLSLSLGGKKRW